MNSELCKLAKLKKYNKHIIKSLIENIDLNNVNFDVIKKNASYLTGHVKKLKQIWKTLPNYYEKTVLKTDLNSLEYKKIISIIKSNQLKNYSKFDEYLDKNKVLIRYLDTDNNITYYVLKNDADEIDEEIIVKHIKITICLKKHFSNFGDKNKETVLIWVPIEKGRDFNEEILNDETLFNSEDNFNAFTASGLTFSLENLRITLITRYEEVDKLLIHELFHNFGLDGSLVKTNDFEKLNKTYKKTKNKTNNFDYTFSIYESYAELSSSYFNLIFKNMFSNNIKKDLITNILVELLYSYNTIYNLARINNYTNYQDFIDSKSFKGNICFFEYYYLKGLMYNNYIYTINSVPDVLYIDVLELIDKKEPLLEDVFKQKLEQINYKFCYY